ncbi:MAG: hypothetical protein Q9166_005933 [cf. Caloplaca sp. 2 TL-2023]
MTNQHYFLSSQLSVPSPDGTLIAIIAASQLHIRSFPSLDDSQIYNLPPGFDLSCRFIRWHQTSGNDDESISQRLLLADDTRIMVFDTKSSQLYAEISGATTLTKLANVDFGWTPNDIMVMSDFGFKLQIWSLATKRAVEVKDPKYDIGYSYRPGTGHLALLTRPAAHDVLMIIAPHSHEVFSTIELSTVDARGIDYSPNGNWLAVWDTASAGCRVLILTADGHHFKTYFIPQHELNLGVRCVQWNPMSDHLAIGDHEGSVTLLGKNTVCFCDPILTKIAVVLTLSQFAPQMRFLHPPTVEIPGGIVWQEELGPSRTRSYTQASQPAESPSHESFQATKSRSSGIALMEFNIHGDLVVSSSSETPSTVWIHSVQSSRPLTALIHHAPIKALLWHSTFPDLLLIQCAMSEATVYLWRASWNTPRTVSLPLKKPIAKLRVSWLSCADERISFMLSSTDQSAIGQFTPEGDEVLSSDSFGQMGPEDMFDEGHSLDLSPVKGTPAIGLTTELGQTLEVDDTFQYRHGGQAAN